MHCNHLPHWNRKPKTDNLKISFSPVLKAISYKEISAVHQKMKGLNYKSITISDRVRRGGLHSILFDNINNKTDNQILGVILDACNHFVRKNSRNSRYITFSSGLNRLKNKHFGQNESCETGICDSGFGNFSGFRLKRKYNFCLVALLAVAMCFFVSCGGKSSSGESVSNFGKLGQECYPNKSCDGSLLCDEEINRCIEDPENPINDENGNKNDENNPIENNDGDKPIEHDDDNGNHEHNDEGNIVDENDNDPMEDNDNVVIPDDKDDVDEINDNDVISNECSPENILFTTEQTEGHSIEEFQGSINNKHNVNRSYCSYGSFTEKERIDTNGNLCIENECNIGSNDIATGG